MGIGHWLNFMTLELFSTLSDPRILGIREVFSTLSDPGILGIRDKPPAAVRPHPVSPLTAPLRPGRSLPRAPGFPALPAAAPSGPARGRGRSPGRGAGTGREETGNGLGTGWEGEREPPRHPYLRPGWRGSAGWGVAGRGARGERCDPSRGSPRVRAGLCHWCRDMSGGTEVTVREGKVRGRQRVLAGA